VTAGVVVSEGVTLADAVAVDEDVTSAVGVGDAVGLEVLVGVAVGAVAVGVGVGGAVNGFSPDHSGLRGDPAPIRNALLGPPGGLGGAVNPEVS
jgi:hypothetical protein